MSSNNHNLLLASPNAFDDALAATSQSNNILGVFLAAIAKGLMRMMKNSKMIMMTRKYNSLSKANL